MSSARSRNFRRRGDDGDEDGDIDASNVAKFASVTTVTASSAKPKKPQNKAPKKLLSFADDEEEEEVRGPSLKTTSSTRRDREKSSSRISKPSSSHRIISNKDRLATTTSSSAHLPSNVQPQAGTYTKEALLELQKNTRTLAVSSSRQQLSSSEPKIILKGLLKPQRQDDAIKQARELDSEDEQQKHDSVRGKLQNLHTSDKDESDRSRLADGEGDESYPDRATVEAIKAKRERMRKTGVTSAPDYISLDGGSNHVAADGLIDEEGEFQGRFMGEKVHNRKKGVFEDVDEKAMPNKNAHVEDYYNDEDEESRLWEEAQVKKGLGKRMDDASSRAAVSSSGSVSMHHPAQQQKYMHPPVSAYGPIPSASISPPSIGGVIGLSNGIDTMSISQQAEVARKALQESVSRLKESRGRTISSLTKTNENLTASLLNITALEESLTAAGEKFIFMQKLRDFVSVICQFLQHKASLIEEIEEQMQELHKKRSAATLERRSADNDDEMMEVEVAVKAAMSVFSERGSSNAVIAAATSAALAASTSIREQTNLPVQLDEFGRDINLQKRKDMDRRAAARNRRKSRFDRKRLSSVVTDGSYPRIEGESSTDESDGESEAYKETQQGFLQCADKVFSDASEEYSQLSAVKERFERWKREYSSTYRDAYISLSVPTIFAPYVRLELLRWDPLHEDIDFFDMKWHLLLFDYGKPEDGSDLTPDDADFNLVPELVEKVALPILYHEIGHCWDVLSTRETRNAVSATSLVTNYVPASSEGVAELLAVIHTRLADAINNVTVPTWTPLVLKAVPNAARVVAYRLGLSVRLMRNICLWKDILALSVLEELVLDELLYGKVLPHIRSIASNVHDAVTRTERIIASLFGVWAGPNITRDNSRKLQPLVDYILLLGKILQKKQASGVNESETGGLARRVKKMLVDLNEYDYAREIARTFHLKEAL